MEHVSLNNVLSRYVERQVQEEKTLSNPLNDKTYNFGSAILDGHEYSDEQYTFLKTRRIIDFNLDIYAQGDLWVNRSDKIAYTDITSNPDNSTSQPYDLLIQKSKCDTLPTLVHVYNSGAEFKIGDYSVGNKANVHIYDAATLKASDGGLLYLDQYSKIYVHDGGKLDIAANGKLQSIWNTQIIVEEGGILQIQSGGILETRDNSIIHVKTGGQLIIESGAEIRLWDGILPVDGEATIRIAGELVLKGSFLYSGNGYF